MQQLDIIKHGRIQQALLWALSLIVIIAGVYLSAIEFMGEEWLTRAGCFVVVLGIGSGLGGIIRERIVSGRLQVRRRFALSRLKRSLRRQRADADRMAAETAALNATFDEQQQALSDHLRLAVGVLEVSLLITGTVLWGFGDLFFR